MFSGFSSTMRHYMDSFDRGDAPVGLPVPFNIPNVLNNLLYKEINIEFDAKQKDMIEALQFAHKSLAEMQKRYMIKEQKLKKELYQNPDDGEYKEAYEELQMDVLEANQHFRELVVVLSELLTREQYAQLMAFSNIAL